VNSWATKIQSPKEQELHYEKTSEKRGIKSKGLVWFEYALLTVCLSVVALRTTLSEGPAMQSTGVGANAGDSLYSLSISTILIFSFALWVTWSFCGRRFSYRPTGVEIGLGILCVGAVAAGFAAADKRLALSDVTVFLAPALMALLMVQILDSLAKTKLVLIVIATLGIVSAYQGTEQFFFSNQATIEQYQKNPKSLLEPLGIEPGSFQQFMFEHRLYSEGVRGFFTTRNSAGSFTLMAFFAAFALFLDKLRKRKADRPLRAHLLGGGLAAALVLASLVLTRSKGAIAGLFLGMAVLVVLHYFGSRLRAHRKAVLAACGLLVIGGSGVLVAYGLSHGRLPGGNSMLVRWQYWHAAAKMYADHPLAGVGPGNFANYYPHYKPAAALESVSDPHNFPLSLLTQYGPFGLIGFLAMVLVPLWRATSGESSAGLAKSDAKTGRPRHGPAFRTLAGAFVIIIPAALLLVRPMLMRAGANETLDVVIYVIVTMYVAPAAVFVVGFVLLAGPLGEKPDAASAMWDRRTVAALSCAILGVGLHNLTDFAIFEPGVLTTFWIVMACLIAIDSHASRRAQLDLKAPPIAKVLVVAGALGLGYAYLNYVLVPVARSTNAMNRANQAISAGQFESAHRLLDEAAEDDPLSAAALSFDGRLYLHQFDSGRSDNTQLLTQAAECLRAAVARNNASFKDFEHLTDVYASLAEFSPPAQQNNWYNKAFDAASLAIERYPDSGRLHFKLARIAEHMGKTATAIEQYKRAIEIENQYRAQFKLMYPERTQVVSRLGEDRYQLALKRVKELSGR
jgi:O-antigen ligase